MESRKITIRSADGTSTIRPPEVSRSDRSLVPHCGTSSMMTSSGWKYPILAAAHTSDALAGVVNPALDAIDAWMGDHGLRLARHKTEAIMLTKKWAYQDPVLGHYRTVSGKASKAALAIGRLMPNLGGPSQSKRALLMSSNKVRYLSEPYDTASKVGGPRVTRAYRTVSAEAALFLAGTPPGDLLALERKRIRGKMVDPDRVGSKNEIREEERGILLAAWPIRWRDGRNRAWTRKILPDLIRWVRRRPKDLTFHVTQVLTGHGCFRDYLHRRNRAPDAACLYCQHPTDTAEHTIFYCAHWKPIRLVVNKFVGSRNITPSDVQDMLCGPSDVPICMSERIMVASQRATQAFYEMVEDIFSCKEQDERLAEAEARAALNV
ncbi:Hypothetical protein CINCED_3A009483 [Cinara cedri]|uniref:Uncharacterized protein n=1 Tax=Cinara cedri TaxID=506608 RepID=A0A5E4M4A6_9HEMI|nr:Hypothetical protein CINCED_3A009483 [Cinara cedri]